MLLNNIKACFSFKLKVALLLAQAYFTITYLSLIAVYFFLRKATVLYLLYDKDQSLAAFLHKQFFWQDFFYDNYRSFNRNKNI